MKSELKNWLKFAGGLLTLMVVIGGVVCHLTALSLVAPAPSVVGPPPADLPISEVSFDSKSGETIKGWLLRQPAARGSLLLLHGIRSDRRGMLDRARFLATNGYNSLLIDLQAHGASGGSRITMGLKEGLDVRSAVRYLKEQFPELPVALMGVSLGGAAALVGDEPANVQAMILESVFSDLSTAIRNRMRNRFGKLGDWLTPLLTIQIKPILGVPKEAISPAEAIKRVTAPMLLIYGADDPLATLAEGELLARNGKGFTELWVVEGAKHEDFHRKLGLVFERRVLEFLSKNMR